MNTATRYNDQNDAYALASAQADRDEVLEEQMLAMFGDPDLIPETFVKSESDFDFERAQLEWDTEVFHI